MSRSSTLWSFNHFGRMVTGGFKMFVGHLCICTLNFNVVWSDLWELCIFCLAPIYLLSRSFLIGGLWFLHPCHMEIMYYVIVVLGGFLHRSHTVCVISCCAVPLIDFSAFLSLKNLLLSSCCFILFNNKCSLHRWNPKLQSRAPIQSY